MRKLYAFLTGRTAVALRDFDGEITYSYAYRTPFGELVCKRHFGLGDPDCVLNEDGTVSGASYVKRWVAL